jgi:hypothetical protein
MANIDRTKISPFFSAQPAPAAYQGINQSRQSRFEARSARRWGDWSILEFPAPVLWLDNGLGLCLYDECEFAQPEVIELWP